MAQSLRQLLEGRFTFSRKTGRYRDSRTGLFVTNETIENALRADLINGYKARTEALGQALIDRQINFAEFSTRMRAEIKKGHSIGGVLGYGGFEQMTPARWGKIGSEVKEHYKRLDAFVREMERAEDVRLAGGVVVRKAGDIQPLDGTARYRAGLYARSIIRTYSVAIIAAQMELGDREARRFLRPAEHCRGCFDEANKGWIPAKDIKPIGFWQCKGNDLCYIRFRKSRRSVINA